MLKGHDAPRESTLFGRLRSCFRRLNEGRKVAVAALEQGLRGGPIVQAISVSREQNSAAVRNPNDSGVEASLLRCMGERAEHCALNVRGLLHALEA